MCSDLSEGSASRRTAKKLDPKRGHFSNTSAEIERKISKIKKISEKVIFKVFAYLKLELWPATASSAPLPSKNFAPS